MFFTIEENENEMALEMMEKRKNWQIKRSLTNVIGTLFNLVQLIRNETWLHQADVSRIHDGNSSKSVNTSSFNCKFDKSPSPRNALTFILSGDKSLTKLKRKNT